MIVGTVAVLCPDPSYLDTGGLNPSPLPALNTHKGSWCLPNCERKQPSEQQHQESRHQQMWWRWRERNRSKDFCLTAIKIFHRSILRETGLIWALDLWGVEAVIVGRHRQSAQLMAADLCSTDCLCGRGPVQGCSLQRIPFSDLPLTPSPTVLRKGTSRWGRKDSKHKPLGDILHLNHSRQTARGSVSWFSHSRNEYGVSSKRKKVT